MYHAASQWRLISFMQKLSENQGGVADLHSILLPGGSLVSSDTYACEGFEAMEVVIQFLYEATNCRYLSSKKCFCTSLVLDS